MNVGTILKFKGSEVISISADETVAKAAQLLTNRRIGALVVGSGKGDIVGMFSERDVVAGISKHGASVLTQPVSTLMTRNVITCDPSDTIVGRGTTRRRPRNVADLRCGRIGRG